MPHETCGRPRLLDKVLFEIFGKHMLDDANMTDENLKNFIRQ